MWLGSIVVSALPQGYNRSVGGEFEFSSLRLLPPRLGSFEAKLKLSGGAAAQD